MLKAIAIDDENMALEVIKAHAGKVPFLDLQAVFSDAIQGLEYLKKEEVDVVFLDINMPDISGIDLAAMLPKETLVIFTTAYSDFAVKGFELEATDYLLKPFPLSRFLKSCQRAQEWKELQPSEEPDHLFIKTSEGKIKVSFDDLLFCEAAGNYVTFQLVDQKLISRMTFKDLENTLPEHFVKTHRSYLINKRKLDRIERHQVHLGKYVVPISVSFSGVLE
ncbi:LytR/AlgR family response regulator transcription factor [Algoriphagus sediminis]|uniref:LytTR family DNA-binding domain-containing protein n=1 Tax=Algoriphagus sediminis TaxID=3057113 RepID=A0ABT7YDX3_9BACT|nr:LytTR family DNA-binding domain-containing protein [Algoriphagus sediminis]MDN3204389.1 LytTR family DNA-binding domain-containing protein [Algoriphagus sediminis]